MLLAVIALQVLLVLLVAVLLLRKPASGGGVDPRLNQVPDALVTLAAKVDASDAALRGHVAELRREQAEAAAQARQAAAQASRELREEVQGSIERLAATLHGGLAAFRADNTAAADKLREAVVRDLNAIGERLNVFFAEARKNDLQMLERGAASQQELRDALQRTLSAMNAEQREGGEKLRASVEAGLRTLNTDNSAKLDEMRVVVDEKLQTTLNERLTASFNSVSDQLTKVHTGLGEMKELASGVSDLKKVFSNVKARGGVGEFLVEQQLKQMFSRDQYEINIAIKANSQERVEYALKIPDGDKDHVLLPIDAKFPKEDWERLEHEYEHGSLEDQAAAAKVFERAIRTQAKKISDKYIEPPTTLPFAIMFLPTEALYAEVMRRPGLHTDLQANYSVTVAGPSSFMAILTSFQMGFRTIAIQKKGNEVWNTLSNVKTQFNKFETLMDRAEGNIRTVQRTLSDIGTRTRAINKQLHDVSELNAPLPGPKSGLLSFEGTQAVVPLLAAMGDEEEAPI